MVLAKRMLFLFLLITCLTTFPSFPSSASELTDALKLRDIAQVRTLLAAGADPNEKVRGDYPLNVAALFGPVEIASLVLDAGARLDQPGRDGMHPLHNAVLGERHDVVVFLISKGAAVDARERRGRTPLYSFACSGGKNIEIPQRLLAAGADPKLEDDEYRETPLNCAIESNNLELVELLMATRPNVNHQSAEGWSALHYAARHLRYEVAEMLIAAGADVNLKNDIGKTPLMETPNDPAMRKLLIDAGAQ